MVDLQLTFYLCYYYKFLLMQGENNQYYLCQYYYTKNQNQFVYFWNQRCLYKKETSFLSR